MIEPSVYERIHVSSHREEWAELPADADGMQAVAHWIESKGAQVADLGPEGLRYRNVSLDYPDQEWRWLNVGHWLNFYNGVEFDLPSDRRPYDVDANEHISGPPLHDLNDQEDHL